MKHGRSSTMRVHADTARLRRFLVAAVVGTGLSSCGGGDGATFVDASFNTSKSGFNGVVSALAASTDGSSDVYAGGNFTSYAGTASSRIIRLDADGSVDLAFDVGTGFDSMVHAIAPSIDASGDVYVGGSFTSYDGTTVNRIVRLDANGAVDFGFDVGTGCNGIVHGIAPRTDGSGDVYVGGAFTSYDGTTSNRIIRLDADGSVDASFDVGAGFNAVVSEITPTTDGSGDVFVGGTFTSYDGATAIAIIRLDENGGVVANFDAGSGFNNVVNAIAVSTDGSNDVYVLGEFDVYDGTSSNRIIRLQGDGSVASSFDVGSGFDMSGTVAIALATDGSGDVYVGGAFTSYDGTTSSRLIRLDATGAVDASFDVGSGFNNAVLSIAPAPDGSSDVLVAGLFTSYDGKGAHRIVRLVADGSPDAGFGIGAGFTSTVHAVTSAADGSGDVYVGGDFLGYDGTASGRIVRLDASGSIAAGFVVGAGFDSTVNAIAALSNGSNAIYVGGNFTSYDGTPANGIVRLDASGSIAVGFAVGTGFDGVVDAIALATDGSGDLYVGGLFTSYDGAGSNGIIRLDANGSFDAGFDVGAGFDNAVRAIAAATDGSGDIYVGGSFTSYDGTGSSRIIRLDASGSIDAAFDVGAGFDGVVDAIAVATDGSEDVYVGGNFTDYDGTPSNGIIRLAANGSIDASFDVGTGFNSGVFAIVTATDGSGDVYVCGQFTSYDGTASNRIVRLDAGGSVDLGFAVGAGFDGSVNAVALATDGSGEVYVGGAFTSYDGTQVDRAAALNPDGSLD